MLKGFSAITVKTQDKSYPIFYLFLYRKIKEKSSSNNLVLHYQMLEVMGRVMPKIAKPYRYAIIKDLEKFNLIKKIDLRKYQIIGGNADIILNRLSYPLWDNLEQ